MGGVAIGRTSNGIGYPNTKDYDVAVSQSIGAGDFVVLTGVGGLTRVRKLVAADITNNFTESTVVKGILGMAMHDIATDANGISTVPTQPTTIAGGVRPVFPLPSYGAGIDADPVTGNARLVVALADSLTEFLIRIQAAANAVVTVNPNTVGKQVGLQIYNTVDFAVNTAASGAGLCAQVSGVDEQDRFYNVSSAQCKAFIKILPAYHQAILGVLYAS